MDEKPKNYVAVLRGGPHDGRFERVGVPLRSIVIDGARYQPHELHHGLRLGEQVLYEYVAP